MLAYDYPILNIFWTMLEFAALFIWIYLIVIVFGDIFRSHDIGGWAKAGWTFLVIFVPLIGVLIYLIARGGKMRERAVAQAQQEQAAFDRYVRETSADRGSGADQLAKLAQLRDNGDITEEEFQKSKAKILS